MIAFNLFFGAIVLLAAMQVVLDIVSLLIFAVTWSFPAVPPEVRYGMGIAALALASFGISQAIRLPPVKRIEVSIPGLSPDLDGYRMVQLTDMHISRLFTGRWASAVVEKTNALDADLITSGVLHSLALMELLNQLEIHYGLRVALERLDFDDFRSVARIAAFVARERTRNRQSSAAMRT